MIVIADSGSTKCNWQLVDDSGSVRRVQSRGINAVLQRPDEVEALLRETFAEPVQADALHFYGAGCGERYPEQSARLREALARYFPAARIAVESDLMGAARALLGGRAGIACILGTGSNSCYYDGVRIVRNTPPLGWVLGDEGSGTYIGQPFPGLVHALRGAAHRPPRTRRTGLRSVPRIRAAQPRALPRRRRSVGIGRRRLSFRTAAAARARNRRVARGADRRDPRRRIIELSHMEQIRVTEQASAYDDLQRMSVHDLLTGINREDRRVADAVAATIPTMERLVERIVERMQRGGRMFYIGAGTSGRLAVTDASELPPTYGVPFDTVIGLIAGGDGALRKAVEHAEDDTEGAWRDMQPWRPDGGDILIGVAASGTTPYVVGGLRTARAHGLLTGAITCNPRSPVAAEAEYALEAVVGPEFVTGSTRMKAGTAQKLMLNMISTAVMIRLGRVEGNKMVNMQLTNNKLVDRGTRMIVQETGIAEAEARALLLACGSVKAALDKIRRGE